MNKIFKYKMFKTFKCQIWNMLLDNDYRELWAIPETEKWWNELKPKLQSSLSFKHELKSTCYGINCITPQNSYVETLISNVIWRQGL